MRRDPLMLIGCAILLFVVCLAIAGPTLSGQGYAETHLAWKNLPPSMSHWFGTDDLGRDLFTRVCYGARISLFVGVVAAFIDLVIGCLWGTVAALSGGGVDQVMMRIADILYAIPNLLVVILLMMVLGSGLIPIFVALSCLGWITMARIVRAHVMQLKNREYVLAARCMGAGFWRIAFKHLLSNALGPILVTMTLTIPGAMFIEAFLSFLGLGVQAPVASWGTMASEGLAAVDFYPWRLFAAAFLMTTTILAFHLIGDRFRERSVLCQNS